MSLITVQDVPDPRHFLIYQVVREKQANVQMSGLLQVTASGHLIVAVPAALVRGVFDAMHEPGISLPAAVDGGMLRAGIVVMTPAELKQAGGAGAITERGKHYKYTLGNLEETPARNWPGVTTCWHLRVKSPTLGELRRSYGLPTKLEGNSDFSIVVACRKAGVLTANATSKVTEQAADLKLPDWTLP
jgi:hypothetical protein